MRISATIMRSPSTYSPLPARLAPGVRAACCDMYGSPPLAADVVARLAKSAASGERPRRRGVEQRPRPPAKNDRLVGGRNRQAANLRHTLRHTHVEGVIAAEQHALGAGITDQELERLLRVHDGIEIEALERLCRRFGKLALRLLAHVPAVHEAPGLVGNKPAAMGEADLQRRIALEHAAENQACGGDGGIERIADQIGEVVRRKPIWAPRSPSTRTA